MRSYLSLIPISARVRKKQNRMTLFCIITAVLLVTAVFSMADMGVRMETRHSVESHGNWHIRLTGISDDTAEDIAARRDVAAVSRYAVTNIDMTYDYSIGGIKTALCGIDGAFAADIMNYFTDGSQLEGVNDIMLTENAKALLGVETGDTVALETPAGSTEFVVSGFRSGNDIYVNSNGGETSALLVQDDELGAFMDTETFRRICRDNGTAFETVCYVMFDGSAGAVKRAVSDIKSRYGISDENIEYNTILMASMGLSDNSYINGFYLAAAVLFVLILIAGVLMISGSMNSNIAERTKFFGMLRCIGASRRQVINFVRIEALNWCKTAVPIGVGLGIAISWILCAVLRYIVRGEFADIEVFGVSVIGIACGVLVGVLTVLFAAHAPARRASRVSPVTAASGNSDDTGKVSHAVNTRFFGIETALGIRHAVSAKKNLVLMTGSFALSIILFLSFSVLVELVGCLIPQSSSAPDLEISCADTSNSIDAGFRDRIASLPYVEHVLSRSLAENVPAELGAAAQDSVDIISYDEYQLTLLEKDDALRSGSDITKMYGDSGYVLTIYDEGNPLEVGDRIMVNGEELEIAGVLRSSPFSNDGTTGGKIDIICSEGTFAALTGEYGSVILDIQLTRDADDEDVSEIRGMTYGKYEFRDRRSEADKSMYWAFRLFVYGFLAVIASITLFNIINSVSMSVSARINQYGAMRAVGMEFGQTIRMIAAETLVYAVLGCIAGCAVGLPLSRFLYGYLITSHFGYNTWEMPYSLLAVIILFVFAASAAAVAVPYRRIKSMSVSETVNEL
ncbi:MAG TPA: FtsX-like permease family protein [Candidatus Ornithomonoglobus merdipullorum]|uniref:FtsX-like permease family protein n=1 Tax=Candidatus Ornithomonoglobus merdipullorum TaxID=2840895 RepID=A0A9D1MCV4_9FIRM|nr:FtsX-like permease family protein [Candidatus Ornithomonoglobus merdipullorum]